MLAAAATARSTGNAQLANSIIVGIVRLSIFRFDVDVDVDLDRMLSIESKQFTSNACTR